MLNADNFLGVAGLKRQRVKISSMGDKEVLIRELSARERQGLFTLGGVTDSGPDTVKTKFDLAFYGIACGLLNEDGSQMFESKDDPKIDQISPDIQEEILSKITEISGLGSGVDGQEQEVLNTSEK